MSSTDKPVDVVVVGDTKTGKTSLILSVLKEDFLDRPAPEIPVSHIPAKFFEEGIPLNVYDTSSKAEDKEIVKERILNADVIILTYSCARPSSIQSLSRYWLPYLRDLKIAAPIIVAGCQLDLRDPTFPTLEEVMVPIMAEFREIETCLECSALKRIQVLDVFSLALKSAVYPISPLFDNEAKALQPRCERALRRIFQICDKDRDGMLSDAELADFQSGVFGIPLEAEELQGIKRMIKESVPEGVSLSGGVTLMGFMFLHTLFIQQATMATTWQVLRAFGYDNDLRLKRDLLPESILKRESDQSVELTEKGIQFLQALFSAHDSNQDGILDSAELEFLFSTSPENPFNDNPYLGATETTTSGGLPMEGFVSLFAMLTLLNPEESASYLQYLGLTKEETGGALRVTKRKLLDRKRGKSQREVLRCLMIGPRGAGKSDLLDSLLKRPINTSQQPTPLEKWAVAPVGDKFPTGLGRQEASDPAFLVIHEVSEDHLPSVLTDPGLEVYDCAAFVYDSSSMDSWERCASLLETVAAVGEMTGNEVPSMLLAAKDDLPPHPSVFPHSAKVCGEMGVPSPVPVSAHLKDTSELWSRLPATAFHPNRCLPETSSARSNKATRRLVLRTTVVVAGTALTVALILSYRAYAQRQHSANI